MASGSALRLALPLLRQSPFACAFAAQSLAQRARLAAPEDAAEWPEAALQAAVKVVLVQKSEENCGF